MTTRREYMNEYMRRRRALNREQENEAQRIRKAKLRASCPMSYKSIRYCERGRLKEVENYDLAANDNFVGWQIHHRLGIDLSRKEMKRRGIYWSRPPEELIFLTIAEHASIHKKARDLKRSLACREIQSILSSNSD